MSGISSHAIPYYVLSDFADLKSISEGGGGIIFTGKLNDFGRMALKQFRCSLPQFKEEVELLIKHRHPNIVHLYGILWDGSDKAGYLGYIMEYVATGSLNNYIYDKEKTYSYQEIYFWVEQIARGLLFLHKYKIIHRDVKPQNILVAPGDQLKLADFGVAKSFDAITTAGAGTVRYMAPEVLLGRSYLSSDIYSLAITIWEIYHRKTPYYQLKEASIFILSNKIINGSRPAIEPDKMANDVSKLIQLCWQEKAEDRPSITEIITRFETKTGYPDQHHVTPKLPLSDDGRTITPSGRFNSLSVSKEITVVLFGEVGIKKSTFINALVNYLKYPTYDEAERKSTNIIKEMIDEATQFPKSYKFSWIRGDNEYTIRIIVPAPVGNEKGLIQDKENFQKTLSFLANFKTINAICILLKPCADVRLDFRYRIKEFFCRLPVSAVQNIFFCLIETSATDALERLYLELYLYECLYDGKVPEGDVYRNKIYSISNESIYHHYVLIAEARYTEERKQMAERAWTTASKEMLRLFDNIVKVEPFNIKKLLDISNIRSVICSMARPMAEMAKTQLLNLRLIGDKIKEIEDRKRKECELKERLYVNQVTIVPKEIEHPRTVCTSGKCVEYMRPNSDPNMPMKTVYKTVCHEPCYCTTDVGIELIPNSALKQCPALRNNINKCKVCGCPWTTHMHIKYELDETLTRVIDPKIQKSINDKQNLIRTAEVFLKIEQQRRDELNKQVEWVSDRCSAFVGFLKKNSILLYNDAYVDYANALINEAEQRDVESEPMKVVLEEYKRFEELLKQTKECAKEHTIKDIYEMVDELKYSADTEKWARLLLSRMT